MPNVFDQLLEKIGVTNFKELRAEERATMLQWMKVLSDHDVTIDDLKKFLPMEAARANAELRNYENSPKKQLFYQAYTTLLTTLSQVITTPASQREQLRQYLKTNFDLEL